MKVLCLSLILSTITFAQMTPNEVRTIENNLNQVDSPTGEFEAQNCCSNEDALKKTMLQCVQDLCGSPNQVDSVYLSNSEFEEDIKDPQIENQFNQTKPDIIKVVEKEKEKAKKLLERIEKNLENENYLDMSEIQDEQASKLIYQIIDEGTWFEIERDDHGKPQVKLEIYDDKITKYLDGSYDDVKEVIINNFLKDFSSKVSYDYYTKEEAKNYILEMHQTVINKLNELKENKPDEYNKLPSYIIDTYLDVSKIEEVIENYEYGTFFHNFKYAIDEINPYLDEPISQYNTKKQEYKCSGTNCKGELQAYVDGFDLRAKVKDLKEQLHDSEYASHFANQCKNTWYSNKVMSIPEEKKKFVQSQLPRIKENLLNNFITPLSNESREETENYLNNLSHHFGTDPKPNDDDSDPVTSIKEYLSSYDDNQYEPSYDEETLEVYKDLNELDDFIDYTDEVQIANTLANYCQKKLFKADDYFYPGMGNGDEPYVHSSNFSCTHYTQGKQIIVHEFGHALSSFFSKKKISEESYRYYMNARTCVTSNHLNGGDSMSGSFKHEGDSFYSEEDMADYFAFKIFPEEKRNLLFCSLLAPTEDGDEWNMDKIAVVHEDFTDTHSTPLTRLIMESLYKGVVPSQSCQNLMDHYKDQIRFNKCE